MAVRVNTQYNVLAVGTQSAASIQSALAAVPLDLSLCRLWGCMPTSDVTINNGVSGLQRNVNLTFDALATAPITANMPPGGGGFVQSLTLGGQVGFWTAPPFIQFTNTFVQAAAGRTAKAVAVMGVGQAVIAAQGSGYNPATTTAKFVDGNLAPGGTAAVAGAVTVAGGKVTAVAITSQGSGYTAFPQIVITDSSGAGSGAEVFGGLTIEALTLVDPGANYASAPIVTAIPYFAQTNNLVVEASGNDICFKWWMTGLIRKALRTGVKEALPQLV